MTLLLYFAACSIMYLQRPQGCNYINSSCWLERKKVSSTMVPAPHALVLGTKLMKQRANNQRKHKTNVNTKFIVSQRCCCCVSSIRIATWFKKHTFWGKHTTPSSVKMEIYLSHTYIEGHFFSIKRYWTTELFNTYSVWKYSIFWANMLSSNTLQHLSFLIISINTVYCKSYYIPLNW